jgi:hypothetical protein
MVFENKRLSKLFGRKREEVTGGNCVMKSFIICTLHQTKENEMGGACDTRGRDEKCLRNFSL